MFCNDISVFLCLFCLAASFSGCGPGVAVGDKVPTVPAAGILTIDGVPLAFYQVTLMPDDGRPASGITNEQGEFVLGTNAVGDGAIVGSHRCAIQFVGPPSEDPEEGMNVFTPPPAPAIKIPKKYNDAKTSELLVTIPANGDRKIEIKLSK